MGLTVLTSISWSHGYWSLSHSKVKSITRPKNCLVFKKQQWLCSAVMLKLSTGCANIRLPHRIEKKQSGKSNERKPGFFNKGNHRLEKQVFSILSHRNLPSTRISRFLAKSPGFLGIFLDPPGFDNGKVGRSALIYWCSYKGIFWIFFPNLPSADFVPFCSIENDFCVCIFQGWVNDFISLYFILFYEFSAWLTLAEDQNGGTMSSDFPLDFFVNVL